MQFGDLPRPAKLLVVGMCLAGISALTWFRFLPSPRDPVSAVIYLALAFIVASKRVAIHRSVASISLGFVLVFAALFRCGTTVAIAAAIINILGCYIFHPKDEDPPGLWVTGYNAASLGVAAFAAGIVYQRLLPGGSQAQLSAVALGAAAAVVAVYYAGSVVAIGLASTLTRLALPPKRWWAELLATGPAYLLGGAIGFALDAAVAVFGHWVWVIALPLGFVIHWSFRTQAAKLEEEVQRREASEKAAGLCLSVVQALSNAIDMKDHKTHTHVQRVHDLAKAVGDRMGLRGDELQAVESAAGG